MGWQPQQGNDSIHTSQIAARTPSPACWGRWRHRASKDARLSTPYGAGWGVARCFGPSRIARPSPRTFVGPYLLSTPHPSPSATPSPLRGEATVKFGGSPVLGRAQGWRFAPPPPAASALTPSAPRAFGHPSGRRNAPPGGRAKPRSRRGSSRRIPGLVAREHRVEDDDQLAHAGDQSDLGFLAPGAQALIVGLEHRVVPGGGAHDRHIKKVAELAASAPDVALAFAGAAVVVVGRGAEEGGGGLVGDMPELGQPGDHAGDRLIAEARHAVDDLGPARKGWVRLDPGGDRGLELAPFGPDRLGDRGQGLSDDRRRAMLALLLDPIFLVFQGRPGLNQPVEFLPRRIVRLGVGVGKRLGEPGDRLGVDRIVLGQPSGRLGEMTNPFRIDDPDFDAGRAQGLRPAPLITAARLHHRPADPVRSQPREQLGLAFRSARRRQAQTLRTNAGVDFALGDIEADNARSLWHTPTPFLARTGSHAHATVRAYGRRQICPSLLRRFLLGGPRAQIQRRAVGWNNRPFADSLTICGHKGARP